MGSNVGPTRRIAARPPLLARFQAPGTPLIAQACCPAEYSPIRPSADCTDCWRRIPQTVRRAIETPHSTSRPPASAVPPLIAQNNSGGVHGFAVRVTPSAVTISVSRSPAAAVPNPFDIEPKPPLWTSPVTPTDAHPPPWSITARLCRDGVVDIDPHRARSDCYGGHGFPAVATAAHEPVLNRDCIHAPGPQEQSQPQRMRMSALRLQYEASLPGEPLAFGMR